MNLSQTLRLLFVAAIWGASHVLARIIVPEIGPILAAISRIGIGAFTVLIILIYLKKTPNLRKDWKFYGIVGLLNTTLPLTLFAFASVHLPSAYLVILNATNPIWSAIFSSLILKDPFGVKTGFSLFLGVGGVVMLAQYGPIEHPDFYVYLSLLFGLLAAACYGLGGVFTKKMGKGIDPALTTGLSNALGVILLAPFAYQAFQTHGAFLFQTHSVFEVGVSLFILGVFGTGIAFVVFYQLLSEVGPFKASLATFLIPVFGLVWGHIFLHEAITFGTIFGAVLVIFSMTLFIKK